MVSCNVELELILRDFVHEYASVEPVQMCVWELVQDCLRERLGGLCWVCWISSIVFDLNHSILVLLGDLVECVVVEDEIFDFQRGVRWVVLGVSEVKVRSILTIEDPVYVRDGFGRPY